MAEKKGTGWTYDYRPTKKAKNRNRFLMLSGAGDIELKPMVRKPKTKHKMAKEMERMFTVIDSDRWDAKGKVSFYDKGYTMPYDYRTKVIRPKTKFLDPVVEKSRQRSDSFEHKLDNAALLDRRSEDHVIKDARLKMLAREEAYARHIDKWGRPEAYDSGMGVRTKKKKRFQRGAH